MRGSLVIAALDNIGERVNNSNVEFTTSGYNNMAGELDDKFPDKRDKFHPNKALKRQLEYLACDFQAFDVLMDVKGLMWDHSKGCFVYRTGSKSEIDKNIKSALENRNVDCKTAMRMVNNNHGIDISYFLHYGEFYNRSFIVNDHFEEDVATVENRRLKAEAAKRSKMESGRVSQFEIQLIQRLAEDAHRLRSDTFLFLNRVSCRLSNEQLEIAFFILNSDNDSILTEVLGNRSWGDDEKI